MDDLISRQTAIDEIKALYEWHEIVTEDKAIDHFKRLPSAEPERKKGRWILNESQRKEDVACGNYLYICSKCGKSDIHAKTQEVPFCWWCGADMRGGEDG